MILAAAAAAFLAGALGCNDSAPPAATERSRAPGAAGVADRERFTGQLSASSSPKSRRFAVRYVTYVDNIPENAEELRLWIPLPRHSLHQRVTHLSAVAPFKHEITTERKYGNRMAFLSVPNPPQQLKAEMTFDVCRFENSARHGRSTDTGTIEVALQADALVPLSAEIREMAESIAKGKTGNRDKALAFYRHVIERMTYDKTGAGWGRGDFQHACKVGRGNCTDYHSYFIGLCRNIGIPAYFEVGLSVPVEPSSGRTGGYHCWGYFWDATQWVPVDISEADKAPEKAAYFFGNLCENRVAFTMGRDIVLEPPQGGEPLNFFIYPYAEVDSKPHKNVRKVSYYHVPREKRKR